MITTTKRYKAGRLIETKTTECLSYKQNVIDSIEAFRDWDYTVESKFYTLGSYKEVTFSHPNHDTYDVYLFTKY